MRDVVDVTIKKLKGEGSYYAHVELSLSSTDFDVEEFHSDDFRVLWDRITFWLIEKEKAIEDIF